MGAVRRVVVVGASLAGVRTADALRENGFGGEITIVGAESVPPYDRPPLSKGALTGESSLTDLGLIGSEDLEAEWRLGTTATRLDLSAKQLELDQGASLSFDGLVVATGAKARRLPSVPQGLPGIHQLRTLEDASELRRELTDWPRNVVIAGGGFIGCELASTCRRLGHRVTVVEPETLPMLGAVGATVAGRLQHMHVDDGVRWKLGSRIESVTGERLVQGVDLDDGTHLPADTVVMAVGAAPVTGWLAGSGVGVNNGVRCDSALRVLDENGSPIPGVVAAGDVAHWDHPLLGRPVRVEHWTSASLGAGVAARTLLAGEGHTNPFTALPTFWSDQCGTRVQGVGMPAWGDDVSIVHGSLEGKFVARYTHAGRPVGAVSVGMPKQLVAEQRLLQADLAG